MKERCERENVTNTHNSNKIALMDSATAAWQMAFYSIPFADGDTVVTTAKSYASNYLAFLHVRDPMIVLSVMNTLTILVFSCPACSCKRRKGLK